MSFTKVSILFCFLISAEVLADKVAQVVTISGDVYVKAPSLSPTKLKLNDEIPEKAQVKTEKNGSVKILFTDDSIMDLGPDTLFKVEDYAVGNGSDRTGIFSLAYGKLRSLVSKPVGAQGSYKVKTKDAIMGIRGTEFVVTAPHSGSGAGSGSTETNLVVASGTVAVNSVQAAAGGLVGGGAGSAPMATTVTAGQSFSSTQFQDASSGTVGVQATTMSNDQMQVSVSSASVKDQTFKASVNMDQSAPAPGKTEQQKSQDSGNTAAMASAAGAVMQTTAATGSMMTADMGRLANGAPTGVSIKDVITAPPVILLPGAIRNVTIRIQ